MRLRRVFRVVGDMADESVRLGMLSFQSRNEHAAFAIGVQDECHRPLRGNERETDVVEDVRGLEEHDSRESVLTRVLGKSARPLRVFGLLDPHAARSFSRQSGSSSRKRRMRSATGGCVTNMRARPSSIKGLTVYSGAVAGLAANSTNSAAWSRRTSASAIGCGEPQIAAAAWSARNSRFGESIR